MSRRSTFIADAESVQGNKGATVTFKAITLDGWAEYVADSNTTDKDLLMVHVLAWEGIEDDDGHDLPLPADEPGIMGKLYTAERDALMRLLYKGAGDTRKKLSSAIVSHMWLRGGEFPDWIANDVREMRMCELYHCLPSQLGGEETYKLQRHQAIRAAETSYHRRANKARG